MQIDTCYQGGEFIIDIVITEEYPFKPPKVNLLFCYFNYFCFSFLIFFLFPLHFYLFIILIILRIALLLNSVIIFFYFILYYFTLDEI